MDEFNENDVEQEPVIKYHSGKVIAFLLPFLLLYLLLNFVLLNAKVSGSAMEKGIPDGSFILANRLAYNSDEPKRGDIIIYSYGEMDVIRRILGVPGDRIVVDTMYDRILVNDIPVAEDYVTKTEAYNEPVDVTLGTDEYFVVGDNRDKSVDCRHYEGNCIKKYNIKGKVFLNYGFSPLRLKVVKGISEFVTD